jgi:tetratricopeptide (TPR) repeat protein
MVAGIEQRLDYARGHEGYAFLHQANLLRDALPEAAPVPVVLWLSRLASTAMPAEAPDLWHWRAANFDFTGDRLPRVEVLRELTTLGREDDLGLSGEQRRARTRMLEDLLSELERQRSPKSKRQKAELADLLLELGFENWHLSRAAEAIPRFERALEIFREIGDQQGAGQAHVGLGSAYADLDEMERAIEHYEQHLKIAREIGDRRGEGQALGNLGSAYTRMYERERAIEYHEQALTIAREIGDRKGEDLALKSMGSTYLFGFEPQGAIKYFKQSLAIAPKGSGLEGLGLAYLGLGQPLLAIEYLGRDLVIAREIGDRQREGTALFNSALAFELLGERAEAIRRTEEALRIYEEIEDPNAERARAQLAEWRSEGGT